MAKEQFFDLVEVAPEARPPVCRIMDFGKFLYQQKKKTHDSQQEAEDDSGQRGQVPPEHRRP